MKQKKSQKIYDEETLKKELEKKEKKAKEIMENTPALTRLLTKVDKKINKTLKVLEGVADYLKLLFNLVKDVIGQRYKEIPLGSLIAVLGALIYFLSPIDLSPDFLPLIGFTDDIAVILLVVNQIKNDLDVYKAWLADRQNGKE
ncbi:MAG: DUF1232 domain-containing protein [Spirochaetales bacterium]|nr:DUF1232 domain-containing protein [Spirochaetales bacterium]